jgi:hypothetical protein
MCIRLIITHITENVGCICFHDLYLNIACLCIYVLYYLPSGAIYDGNYKDFVKHGHGKFTFSNGDVYEGKQVSYC